MALWQHQTIRKNITELEFERNDDLVWPWVEEHGRCVAPPVAAQADLQRTLRRGYYAAVSFWIVGGRFPASTP